MDKQHPTARQRAVIVAFADTIFAGYTTIKWLSDYPPFRTANIPENQRAQCASTLSTARDRQLLDGSS